MIPLRFLLSILVVAGSSSLWASSWTFEPGLSFGNPLPCALQLGVHRDDWGGRVAYGFWYRQSETWWTGTTLSLDRAIIRRKRYSLELGVVGNYYYTQALDSMAVAVNEVSGKQVLTKAQWLEWYGLGPGVSVRWYGLFAQASWVALQNGDLHRNLEWRAGFSL